MRETWLSPSFLEAAIKTLKIHCHSKTLIKKDPFQLLKETIIPNIIALTAKCQNYEE